MQKSEERFRILVESPRWRRISTVSIMEQKRVEIALQKTASRLKPDRKSLTEKNIALSGSRPESR
jgi:hypothetical protein